jgi:hypothetical protein
MSSVRYVALTILGCVLFAACSPAQDLSSYRGFQFGASLESIISQTGMRSDEAKIIHTRPALIQELEWRIRPSLDSPSTETDSVKSIVFSFYNGQLFRIAVSYNRERTEGLTDHDMIESISAKYGVAAKPSTKTITFSSSQIYNDNEKVIACWEDAQYSFNLFRSTYEPTFGIVAFSKAADLLARAAVAQSIRQDQQEAPQRLKDQAEVGRIAQEKSRISNKAAFRP